MSAIVEANFVRFYTSLVHSMASETKRIPQLSSILAPSIRIETQTEEKEKFKFRKASHLKAQPLYSKRYNHLQFLLFANVLVFKTSALCTFK